MLLFVNMENLIWEETEHPAFIRTNIRNIVSTSGSGSIDFLD